MKTILEFDLPGDSKRYKFAIEGYKTAGVIKDMMEIIRRWEDDPETDAIPVSCLRKVMVDLLAEHDL